MPADAAHATPPAVALALQGGGSHGAFTWGVLDRLLTEVEAGRLRIAAVSGASAGAMNAALLASGLVQGGPPAARRKLRAFWRAISLAGFMAGNEFVLPEPNLAGGFNLDNSPAAIGLGALGLVVSPYTNPLYSDALAPLLAEAFPDAELAALNAAAEPCLLVGATDIASNARVIFRQPHITRDVLRASAALPTEFKAVSIDGTPYWDGGYLGNPALSPLLAHADDLLLVLVNAFHRSHMPPHGPGAIADRLNEITFNASVVLELNAIHVINELLADVAARGLDYSNGRFRPIRVHAIRNDAFAASLGYISKNSTSWALLTDLHDAGHRTADHWLAAHGPAIGKNASMELGAELATRLGR